MTAPNQADLAEARQEGARAGRIVTFYSYKGGTGRSLLVANAAMVLASNGRRVAVIDWDLEAPGLHRYFRPFISDVELTETTGLIDLFTGYWDKLIELESDGADPAPGWEQPYLDIYRYAVTLRLPAQATSGSIVFVPAGRQNAAYASKVANFDWDTFYANAGGRGFIDALAKRLRAEFDIVLIDSRTGVSDTSGICTIQLPDDLVICFTYNNQNLLGASGVAANAHCARAQGRDPRRLRIFPVPTRADYFLQTYLEPRRQLAKALMGWALPDEEKREPDRYWAEMEQPYLPLHSYFETLACLTDEPSGPPPSLLLSTQHVVRRFTGGEVQRWIPLFDDATRLALRGLMEGAAQPEAAPAARPSPASAVVSRAAWSDEEFAQARPLLLRLVAWDDAQDALVFRACSSVLFDHLSRLVDRLLERGLIVVRPAAGGSSLLELSSFARTDDLRGRVGSREWRRLNELLLKIEDLARRWRVSSGHDRTLLKGPGWLADGAEPIETLKSEHVLTPGEELYLMACEKDARDRAAWRRTLGVVGIAMAIVVALTFWVFDLQLKNERLNNDAAYWSNTLSQQKSLTSAVQRQFDDARFDALLGKGHNAFALKNYSDAVDDFTAAAAAAPVPNADLYRARSEAYARLAGQARDSDEANTLRQKSMDDLETWVGLAETCSRRLQVADQMLLYKAPARAVAQVDRAARIAGNDPSAVVSDHGLQLTQQLLRQGAISSSVAGVWANLFRAATPRPDYSGNPPTVRPSGREASASLDIRPGR